MIEMSKIKELIYDGEYDKVKAILQKEPNSIIHKNILKLIRRLEKIENLDYLMDEFQYNSESPFRNYFQALRYQDYESAYYFCKECMKIRNDNSEFSIYQIILEDIIAAIKKKNRLYEIDAELEIYCYKKGMINEEDKVVMETLLNEKLSLKYDEHSQNMLDIIEVLKQVNKYQLDINFFANFGQEENNSIHNFLKMIQQGDYKTALHIINKIENLKTFCNSIGFKNVLLYRKLLLLFGCQTVVKKRYIPVNDISEETQNETLEQLNKLREIIRKKDYIHAFLYYQKYMNNPNQEIKILLDYLQQCQLKECYGYYHQYKYYLKRGDIRQANQFFKLYKKAIKGTILDRKIDYLKMRMKILKKEISTHDFVKKEQIYDRAEYYYQNNMYLECIQALNEYIILDKDIDPKGYLLRGRSYEKLKKYDQAVADYQKVIEMVPSPGAYLRLSVLLQSEEETLKNSLAYEEIKPCYNTSNIQRIMAMYQLLEDIEKVKIYQEMLDYLEKGNQKLLQYQKI